MASEVEHPDIRYVVYPVHLDGTPTGADPRLRHHPDCSHFEWRDGTVLGSPQQATDEQMQTLRACKTCIETRRGPGGGDTHRADGDGRTGGMNRPGVSGVSELAGPVQTEGTSPIRVSWASCSRHSAAYARRRRLPAGQCHAGDGDPEACSAMVSAAGLD
jgi:hypothetical protein